MVELAGVDQPSANVSPARGLEHRVCSEGWADGEHSITDAGLPAKNGWVRLVCRLKRTQWATRKILKTSGMD